MTNQKRFDKLRALSPLEAVQAWLDGDFGFGEEAAMIAAIRKDTRVMRSDVEIIDFMTDALTEEDADAQNCLDLLAKS